MDRPCLYSHSFYLISDFDLRNQIIMSNLNFLWSFKDAWCSLINKNYYLQRLKFMEELEEVS